MLSMKSCWAAARRGQRSQGKRLLSQRAVVLDAPGGDPESLTLRQIPVPEPSVDGSVRVRIAACAVAYRDVLDRRGAFPFIQCPAVLGHEFVGVVDSVHHSVKHLKVGERVASMYWAQSDSWPSPLRHDGPVPSFFGLTCHGGYQEAVCVDESAFVRVPETLDWTAVETAPAVSTFGTVHHAMVTRAELRAGETVLVTGASGGVGSAAVRLALQFGCRVIAVTSSEAKVGAIRSLAASPSADALEVIVAPGGDFHRHSALTGGGVDVALEAVGSPTFSASLKSLRPGGRAVLLGNVENAAVKLPLGLCIVNCPILEMERVFGFLERHDMRPHIAGTMPLEEAHRAHTMLEQKGVTGRLVLDINDEIWGGRLALKTQ